jgi:hypothetical protein
VLYQIRRRIGKPYRDVSPWVVLSGLSVVFNWVQARRSDSGPTPSKTDDSGWDSSFPYSVDVHRQPPNVRRRYQGVCDE